MPTTDHADVLKAPEAKGVAISRIAYFAKQASANKKPGALLRAQGTLRQQKSERTSIPNLKP